MAIDEIRDFQRALNLSGYQPALQVDGNVTPQTRDAISWFQGAQALRPTGRLDAETIQAAQGVLDQPGRAAAAPRVVGVCVHGLGNDVLGIGIGIDNLSAELNQKANCKIWLCDQDPSPIGKYGNRAIIEKFLQGASQSGARIVYIGHSFGADLGVEIANSFQTRKIAIPLLLTIDPVCWESNTSTPGEWSIPPNVDVAQCFYSNQAPGGGHIVDAPGNTHTTCNSEFLQGYTHINIATAPRVHQWCSQAVDKLLAPLVATNAGPAGG